jgi:hypothetical protein
MSRGADRELEWIRTRENSPGTGIPEFVLFLTGENSPGRAEIMDWILEMKDGNVNALLVPARKSEHLAAHNAAVTDESLTCRYQILLSEKTSG